eukprot:CAMPEP_0119003706 /NCGR_PEP_ID=MMETSP1176-20130426/720_1 /TAXON_ID=265551 /ORGANISM="Synedropsis recta cf, Strain CCMP1620" /LENGTH=262 /DNA_ID=CAMNT_0006955329 /DNA_START=97 /DNA_END=885 /DNA_ORIENTATION=+
MKISLILLICSAYQAVEAFQIPTSQRSVLLHPHRAGYYHQPLHMSDIEDNSKPLTRPEIVTTKEEDDDGGGGAATNTINERLMTELQEAADKEKFGARSSMTKKMGLGGFKSDKTDDEQQAAIDAARNLNGVNPAIALAGGAFGLVMAGALWFATLALADFFSMNPVETDVYFVQRSSSVIRNICMGLASLAAGFFGVTGVGIFALGIKVAIGVAKGELDPTPIKKKPGEEIELPNVWDLMMNKKPTRRGGNSNDDNNPFGN